MLYEGNLPFDVIVGSRGRVTLANARYFTSIIFKNSSATRSEKLWSFMFASIVITSMSFRRSSIRDCRNAKSASGSQNAPPGTFGMERPRVGTMISVTAPRLGEGQHYRAFKVSEQFDEDISAVMLGARIDVEGRRIVGARVAYGGMAATPKRAAAAERALTGADLDEPASWRGALSALASDFRPLTDQRASAAYRVTVAANVLEKTLMEISGATAPTRNRDAPCC